MKTNPMNHQRAGDTFLRERPNAAALGAEQGTGKTWMLLNDIEVQLVQNRIDAALVIAPKGVHTNWVVEEIPKHLSLRCDAIAWSNSKSAKSVKVLKAFLTKDPRAKAVKILSMNFDAINTKDGYKVAKLFLETFRVVMIVDESQRIKNPAALRTKKIHNLGKLAVSRRIASGTLVANSPLDLYGQFTFLDPKIFKGQSYRAFTSEYAEILPATHPMVAQIIASQRLRGVPQIVKKDKRGRSMYKNTDKLAKIIAPFTYRVTKEECLDLPAKIYKKHFFNLSKQQAALYNQIKEEMCIVRDDGDIDTLTALTAINKLRQVTSGFIIMDGIPAQLVNAEERLKALEECLEDNETPAIIWATFTEEIRMICKLLHGNGKTFVQYHGETSNEDRSKAVSLFQAGAANYFVGNPAAGGTGITLNKARSVVYYSCNYSLEQRLQSEDRAHRIGTRFPVVYTDLVALKTVDEQIAKALQNKQEAALEIYNRL
jgi:SNF2 family DNA or RNA helicase